MLQSLIKLSQIQDLRTLKVSRGLTPWFFHNEKAQQTRLKSPGFFESRMYPLLLGILVVLARVSP